jgi:hypothetical protein
MSAISRDQLRSGYRTATGIGVAAIGVLCACAVGVELAKNGNSPVQGLMEASHLEILRYGLLGAAGALFSLIRAVKNFILSRPISLPILESGGFFSEPVQTLIEVATTTYALCGLAAVFGLSLYWLTGEKSAFYLFFVLSLVLFAIFFPRYGEWGEWIKEVERAIDRTKRSLIRSQIARILGPVGKVSEYVWVYPVNLEYRLFVMAGLIAGLLGVLFFAPFIGLRASLLLYVLLVGLNIPYVLIKKEVEIDRRRGIVLKRWGVLAYRKETVYQLSEFSNVTLHMRGISRYGTWPLYVVYLVGASSPLKLFDTMSEERAGKQSRGLAEFLGVEFVNRTGQWDLI